MYGEYTTNEFSGRENKMRCRVVCRLPGIVQFVIRQRSAMEPLLHRGRTEKFTAGRDWAIAIAMSRAKHCWIIISSMTRTSKGKPREGSSKLIKRVPIRPTQGQESTKEK